MPPPSPKAKMLESLRIPDGEGMPSPYNVTIRYAAKQSFIRVWGIAQTKDMAHFAGKKRSSLNTFAYLYTLL